MDKNNPNKMVLFTPIQISHQIKSLHQLLLNTTKSAHAIKVKNSMAKKMVLANSLTKTVPMSKAYGKTTNSTATANSTTLTAN
jgi:hypothetical protein